MSTTVGATPRASGVASFLEPTHRPVERSSNHALRVGVLMGRIRVIVRPADALHAHGERRFLFASSKERNAPADRACL